MTDLVVRCVVGDRSVDLAVAVDGEHTVAELADAIAHHFGSHPGDLLVRGRRLESGRRLDLTDLMPGDVVTMVPAGPDASPADASPADISAPAGSLSVAHHPAVCLDPGLVIDVIAGPDAGRSVRLSVPGRHDIGRGRDASIRIDDPTVSRLHLRIEARTPNSVTAIPDPSAVNGVCVNGEEITAPTVIGPTDVVALGGTRLVVRQSGPSETRGMARFGRIDVHRTPYRRAALAEPGVDLLGPVPDGPATRRVPLIGMLAPVLAGVITCIITGQLQFLVIALVSPIVMIASAIDDRRSGRRDHRCAVAAFRERIVAHRALVVELRDRERRDRFREAPDLADLCRRATARSLDLWARSRHSPDFLRLRLGLGSDRVRFAVGVAEGGAPDLRAEAVSALEGLSLLEDVPVIADLITDPVVGLHGDRPTVDAVAAGLVAQAATWHSPDDLIAVAAAPGLTWAKWLPHTRSIVSPLPGGHTADAASVGSLLGRLVELAERRAERGADQLTWPRFLVVIDAATDPDPVRVSRLLDLAPTAGVSVLWLCGSLSEVPRQATRVLDVRRSPSGAVRGRWWSTDPSVDENRVEVDHLAAERADGWARALAPVRDASSSTRTTAIPRVVSLFEALEVGRPTPEWVMQHWSSAGPGLSVPIGVGADGIIRVDLVEHGPHALIGGTSGSGKSELLQSFVVGLAAGHPPSRLNVLVIDYKGGAAGQVLERLPHTVGVVTNLSPTLAHRALVSLRSELERRMALFRGRAKDLPEFREVAPGEAPPALVILVDEFATLVREIPDFVSGLVDIAQRGRSLGIHLVLATQRPSGAVDENILANTNVRIALRVLDRSESTSIVGVPDAVDVPVPLRGRGIVRLGAVEEFQAAFAGAPVFSEGERPPVSVVRFDRTDVSPRHPVVSASAQTQLDAVIDAVVGAAVAVASPPPRRPWCEELPDRVSIAEVIDRLRAADPAGPAFVDPGRWVAIGLADRPERQEQGPAVLDLVESGGLLVFGSGGSGRSTVLGSIATSLQLANSGRQVVVVGFDFHGRGLSGLAELPVVAGVATVDAPERVSRMLTLLASETRRRATTPSSGDPRIVVIVDGLPDDVHDPRVDELVRIALDGRSVGVHLVLAVENRLAVPSRLLGSVAGRLVLRQADPGAASDHGVGADLSALPPGRGVLGGSTMVQVADAPASVVEELARRDRPAPDQWCARLTGVPLPVRARVERPSGDLSSVPIGVMDVSGAVAAVDLTWSDLTICGAPRSGRSTALSVVVHHLGTAFDTTVVGPASSPLRCWAGCPGVDVAVGAEAPRALDDLERRARDRDRASPLLLVVDDADDFESVALERLVGVDNVRLVVGLEQRSMSGFTVSPVVQAARRARRLLVLGPDDPVEFLQATGVRLAIRDGVEMVPGRGVLLVDRVPSLVQVAEVAEGVRRSVHGLVRDLSSRPTPDPPVTPCRYSRRDVP